MDKSVVLERGWYEVRDWVFTHWYPGGGNVSGCGMEYPRLEDASPCAGAVDPSSGADRRCPNCLTVWDRTYMTGAIHASGMAIDNGPGDDEARRAYLGQWHPHAINPKTGRIRWDYVRYLVDDGVPVPGCRVTVCGASEAEDG